MNKKICFITCVNNNKLYEECLKYINNLRVPEGYEIEIKIIKNAKSLTSGYNEGMLSSDAKYKVYLHQDTFIINKNFINDILKIFDKDKTIGMIGVVGAKTLPINAVWWHSNKKYGKVYENRTGEIELLAFNEVEGDFEEVKVIDGLIMITQYDIPWREDIFTGWHFYDLSQCMEFMKRGFKIVIPKQNEPWCIHNCGFIEIKDDYEKYRKIFLNEYPLNKYSSVYDYFYNERQEIISLIESKASRVLDVGCAAGLLGKKLKTERPGTIVYGVEINRDIAQEAEQYLDKVLVGDIYEKINELPDRFFDTIILADVIEHLNVPEVIIKKLKSKLAHNGEFIISVPNFRHWSVIMKILFGDLSYEEAGIMDKTHLRIFTKYIIHNMMKNLNLEVIKISKNVVPLEANQKEILIKLLGAFALDVRSFAADIDTYQYIYKVKPREYLRFSKLTSIIILTLNNYEISKQCIESVLKFTNLPFELIIVDNGSTETQLLEYLKNLQERRDDVKVYFLPENVGYGLGNNFGLLHSVGKYVVFLNNDTIVTPDWLEKLIIDLNMDEKTGLIGPRTNYVSGEQIVNKVNYKNMNELLEFANKWEAVNYREVTETKKLVGFCLLAKREVIEKIGGFDPLFEIGNFEDDDLCRRAYLAGFKLKIADDVFIHHYGSKTFISEKINYDEIMKKNREKYLKKWEVFNEIVKTNYLSIIENFLFIKLVKDREDFGIPENREVLFLALGKNDNNLDETLISKLIKKINENEILVILVDDNQNHEEVEEKLIKAITMAGFTPEDCPDVLLHYSKSYFYDLISLIKLAKACIVIDERTKKWAEVFDKDKVDID
ncbi:glycosyltransferase [Carboxydothermus hydrogenoformans]|uniref:Glycosyl transferase, group 2 family n=1 Tax=Carboxydothermus hydrogenoformans (strain ATCC BAA-161 / DSM 6008 / Z-2901) TaxID=246194 RepID=Q3ADF7_CARHZ|nr:glycosyltransferase [Carboxydothermus hydrogenoformans]ABB14724.1 glycosyl transferase, group 2 family [Carboxydothermus hydrogenoformans Z-2901]